jgi:hypothetical protein
METFLVPWNELCNAINHMYDKNEFKKSKQKCYTSLTIDIYKIIWHMMTSNTL